MLVDLGHGWWIEQDGNRVRMTLRGQVSGEWPAGEWARMMGRLALPPLEPRHDHRVHVRKSATRAACGLPLGVDFVVVDSLAQLGPNDILCQPCRKAARRMAP